MSKLRILFCRSPSIAPLLSSSLCEESPPASPAPPPPSPPVLPSRTSALTAAPPVSTKSRRPRERMCSRSGSSSRTRRRRQTLWVIVIVQLETKSDWKFLCFFFLTYSKERHYIPNYGALHFLPNDENYVRQRVSNGREESFDALLSVILNGISFSWVINALLSSYRSWAEISLISKL